MCNVLESMRDHLLRQNVRSCRIVVAVSGGPDSLALLCGLAELAGEFDLELIAAHLDHALRPDSKEEARWLAGECKRMQIPFVMERIDIEAEARAGGHGIEETARDMRYNFLERTAIREAAALTAVGHNADDQAETILHNLLRGTGLAGLAGMQPLRPLGSDLQVFRPLLEVTRPDIEAYLRAKGQEWKVDRSNCDAAFTRNRLRHELLPLLRKEFNPRISDVLLRLGRQAEQVQDLVARRAETLLSRSLVGDDAAAVLLDCSPLRNEPTHLVRECLKQVWIRRGWPRRYMGFAEWERLANIACSDEEEMTTMLPGEVTAHRLGARMVLERRTEAPPHPREGRNGAGRRGA